MEVETNGFDQRKSNIWFAFVFSKSISQSVTLLSSYAHEYQHFSVSSKCSQNVNAATINYVTSCLVLTTKHKVKIYGTHIVCIVVCEWVNSNSGILPRVPALYLIWRPWGDGCVKLFSPSLVPCLSPLYSLVYDKMICSVNELCRL